RGRLGPGGVVGERDDLGRDVVGVTAVAGEPVEQGALVRGRLLVDAVHDERPQRRQPLSPTLGDHVADDAGDPVVEQRARAQPRARLDLVAEIEVGDDPEIAAGHLGQHLPRGARPGAGGVVDAQPSLVPCLIRHTLGSHLFCDDVLARIDAPPPPPKRRQALPEYRAGMGVRQAGLPRRWPVPLAAVASLVAAVGPAGGFRDAEGYAGPAVDPGEEITLARWRITVDEAELIDSDAFGPGDTRIRLHLTVTLTDRESTYALPEGLVTLVVPGGPEPEPGFGSNGVWSTQLDPDITRTYLLVRTWPPRGDDDAQPPIGTVPDTVTVVVRDEVDAQGPLFREWRLDDVAAVVTLPLTDLREEP